VTESCTRCEYLSAELRELREAARDVVMLEWPRIGQEVSHPAKGMQGPQKWRRLKLALGLYPLRRRR
jgi:hypothetical protein